MIGALWSPLLGEERSQLVLHHSHCHRCLGKLNTTVGKSVGSKGRPGFKATNHCSPLKPPQTGHFDSLSQPSYLWIIDLVGWPRVRVMYTRHSWPTGCSKDSKAPIIIMYIINLAGHTVKYNILLVEARILLKNPCSFRKK